MSIFDENTIEVKEAGNDTLYVCNFPPTADEQWIRDKFQPVSSHDSSSRISHTSLLTI